MKTSKQERNISAFRRGGKHNGPKRVPILHDIICLSLSFFLTLIW